MTESDQSSNACQSFTINVKAFKRLPQIFPFYLLSEKQFIFGLAFQILRIDRWKTIFMLLYIITDLPIFVIAEWATLLVDIRCPRGDS